MGKEPHGHVTCPPPPRSPTSFKPKSNYFHIRRNKEQAISHCFSAMWSRHDMARNPSCLSQVSNSLIPDVMTCSKCARTSTYSLSDTSSTDEDRMPQKEFLFTPCCRALYIDRIPKYHPGRRTNLLHQRESALSTTQIRLESQIIRPKLPTRSQPNSTTILEIDPNFQNTLCCDPPPCKKVYYL
jgi:hypothetical protein